MPRTSWLLAAAAVLPLLVPPSAVSYPPGLEATEISSAKVCGAGECREVSDPEAATALGRPRPAVHGASAAALVEQPAYGSPRARAALVQEHAHDPRRGARRGVRRPRSVIVVPSAGLMRVEDGFTWVTLPSESEEAYAKLTAGLTPRPARTFPGVGETPSCRSPASMRSSSPRARPPRRATARRFGSSRWAAAC